MYTFMDKTLVAALLKFSEVTFVIFPPAQRSPVDTLTIFATCALEFPVVLGLLTMVNVALSYPTMPAVADSKLKGRVWAEPASATRTRTDVRKCFIGVVKSFRIGLNASSDVSTLVSSD